MNKRALLQLVLLVLAGVSLAAWAWRSFAGGPAGAERAGSPPEAAKDAAGAVAGTLLADGVAVVNFHGRRR